MGMSTGLWDYWVRVVEGPAQESCAPDGVVPGVRQLMTVIPAAGKQVGSGGQAVTALVAVLNRELAESSLNPSYPAVWEAALQRLRVLIQCMAPGSAAASCTAPPDLPPSLTTLPPGLPDKGQVVVVQGDIVSNHVWENLRLDHAGVTATGSGFRPGDGESAGVYRCTADGTVLRCIPDPFLVDTSAAAAASISSHIYRVEGLLSFDAHASVKLLKAAGVAAGIAAGETGDPGKIGWTFGAIGSRSFNLDREFCTALGTQASSALHVASARTAGSTWPVQALNRLYRRVHGIPFHITYANSPAAKSVARHELV